MPNGYSCIGTSQSRMPIVFDHLCIITISRCAKHKFIIDLVSMGKHAQEPSQSDSDSDVEDIVVQVEKAIKVLPTLQEKVQAIAINGYMEQRKTLDDNQEKEINSIEFKYRAQMQPLIDRMNAIIEGSLELKDADLEGAEEILTDEERNSKKNYYTAGKVDGFWLRVLKNDMISSTEIRQCDEPILMHLKRIEAQKSEDENKLTVRFHFQPNDYFTNSVITKGFERDGDDLSKSFGDKINWKEGKNVTVKVVKKKNKNKKTGQKVVKTKEVKEESFFNFFNPIDINEDNDQEQEQNSANEQLENQYELASHIYEQVVPYCIESYLGVDSLDDFEDLGGFQEMDEDDDYKPKKVTQKHRKKSKEQEADKSKSKSKSKSKEGKEDKKGKIQQGAAAGENPQCKQQ